MNILDEIYQHKLIEVRNRKKEKHLNEICDQNKCDSYKPKDFFKALQNKVNQGQIALICEAKKASPSKGIIRENFDVKQIVKDYESAGAACISVLSDEKYFSGSNEYVRQARENTGLPILRKEFIVDEYQIYETKMLGGDCILLIVAMLDDEKLSRFENCALSIGLSVLIEVHDEEELQRALKLKSKLIGINNRDLKTLKVDINNSIKLSKLVPQGYLVVAESGIKTKSDIELLQKSNINCFLIGEQFMSEENIIEAVKKLYV